MDVAVTDNGGWASVGVVRTTTITNLKLIILMRSFDKFIIHNM